MGLAGPEEARVKLTEKGEPGFSQTYEANLRDATRNTSILASVY